MQHLGSPIIESVASSEMSAHICEHHMLLELGGGKLRLEIFQTSSHAERALIFAMAAIGVVRWRSILRPDKNDQDGNTITLRFRRAHGRGLVLRGISMEGDGAAAAR